MPYQGICHKHFSPFQLPQQRDTIKEQAAEMMLRHHTHKLITHKFVIVHHVECRFIICIRLIAWMHGKERERQIAPYLTCLNVVIKDTEVAKVHFVANFNSELFIIKVAAVYTSYPICKLQTCDRVFTA